jgi:ankyrin repeat protein
MDTCECYELENVIRKSNLEKVKKLIKNNKDILFCKCNQRINTPFPHICVRYDIKFTVIRLILSFFDINDTFDETGFNPLHYLCKHGNCLEKFKLLIELGADVNIATVKEKNLYTTNNYRSFRPLYIVYNENNNDIMKITIMELLIDHGADVNVCSDDDNFYNGTILCAACRDFDFPIINLLLENNADVICEELPVNKRPLYMFLKNCIFDIDIITTLIENGSDIEINDIRYRKLLARSSSEIDQLNSIIESVNTSNIKPAKR